MTATGTFEVQLESQSDDGFPAGRMTIHKTYSGGLIGTGIGQMLSKRTEGESVYCAIEEFQGELDGKSGGFTLIHKGVMTANKEELSIVIVEGSGTGELSRITGEMKLDITESSHHYTLSYTM